MSWGALAVTRCLGVHWESRDALETQDGTKCCAMHTGVIEWHGILRVTFTWHIGVTR